jgi:hypothetical protein
MTLCIEVFLSFAMSFGARCEASVIAHIWQACKLPISGGNFKLRREVKRLKGEVMKG